MSKTIAIAAICMLIIVPASAQNISYVLSSVSEPVKKNAQTVTRFENTVFEVADINRATLSAHKVVTVIDSKGSDAQNFVVYTDKSMTLDDVEIKVYNSFGKQVNRYRKKDIQTIAFGDGLVDDGYYTYFRIPAPSYPFTFEIKYDLRFKGTLFLPDFNILSPGEGVGISTFTARVPKDIDIRYREKNISLKPEVTEDAKYKVYKWTVKYFACRLNTIPFGWNVPAIRANSVYWVLQPKTAMRCCLLKMAVNWFLHPAASLKIIAPILSPPSNWLASEAVSLKPYSGPMAASAMRLNIFLPKPGTSRKNILCKISGSNSLTISSLRKKRFPAFTLPS